VFTLSIERAYSVLRFSFSGLFTIEDLDAIDRPWSVSSEQWMKRQRFAAYST
jgi:hypothetical protein